MSNSDDVEKLQRPRENVHPDDYTVPAMLGNGFRPRDLYKSNKSTKHIGHDRFMKDNEIFVQTGLIYSYATNEHHPNFDKHEGTVGFFRNPEPGVCHFNLMTAYGTVWELGMEELEYECFKKSTMG